MVKKGNAKKAVDANLLNFHFSSGAPVPQSRPRSGSFNNNFDPSQRNVGGGRGSNSRAKVKEYQRSAEDRTSARRKAASSMFPLHSSPDHAFVITRQKVSHTGTTGSASHAIHGNYTFHGPDNAVSWESVRIVKYLVPLDQLESSTVCPICLDTFTVLRITKCGHCFCLPCLVHHVQSFADKTYAPKCPCCAIPLHLQDLRPVHLIQARHTSPPAIKSVTRFRKLHRVKDCPTPYIPHLSQPRRSSPHSAPCAADADAAFCKFNYLDVLSYQGLLEENIQELLRQQSTCTLEAMCMGTAVQIVQDDLNRCAQETVAELAMQEQFYNPAAGMYQLQHTDLQATGAHVSDRRIAAQSTGIPVETANLERACVYSSSWDDAPLSPSPNDGHAESGDHVENDANEEAFADGTAIRRGRGDSISSCGGMSACSDNFSGKPASKSVTWTYGGSMYAHENEYAFYQDEDGSLCFLSGFNMLCLQAEYSTTRLSISEIDDSISKSSPQLENLLPPTLTRQAPSLHSSPQPPLPDIIEGRVLEVERIHLTADIRQRRRFLSHIPLHVDICMVEINIGHLLSQRTKQHFKKEFLKRNQKRLSKETAEKKSDERIKRQEEERIQKLKSRVQRIDPNDEFFQPLSLPDLEPNLPAGEDFGPSLSALYVGEASLGAVSSDSIRRGPDVSFSQICRSGDAFPSLNSAPTEENFPALGSSPPTTKRAPPARPWGSTVKSPSAEVVNSAVGGGKKGKGKKIVLFSTGGFRGDYT